MLQFDIKFAISAECIKIIVCLQCEPFHCSPLLRATSAKDGGGPPYPSVNPPLYYAARVKYSIGTKVYKFIV